MNISEKVIDIIKGMEGIGGIPTDQEFLDEFEFRLQALKQGQTLPIDNVIVPKGTLCDVCGSDDIIEAPSMGRNCNSCNPI